MISTPLKFAILAVAAGVVATGPLWTERSDNMVRSQDVVEVRQAVVERCLATQRAPSWSPVWTQRCSYMRPTTNVLVDVAPGRWWAGVEDSVVLLTTGAIIRGSFSVPPPCGVVTNWDDLGTSTVWGIWTDLKVSCPDDVLDADYTIKSESESPWDDPWPLSLYEAMDAYRTLVMGELSGGSFLSWPEARIGTARVRRSAVPWLDRRDWVYKADFYKSLFTYYRPGVIDESLGSAPAWFPGVTSLVRRTAGPPYAVRVACTMSGSLDKQRIYDAPMLFPRTHFWREITPVNRNDWKEWDDTMAPAWSAGAYAPGLAHQDRIVAGGAFVDLDGESGYLMPDSYGSVEGLETLMPVMLNPAPAWTNWGYGSQVQVLNYAPLPGLAWPRVDFSAHGGGTMITKAMLDERRRLLSLMSVTRQAQQSLAWTNTLGSVGVLKSWESGPCDTWEEAKAAAEAAAPYEEEMQWTSQEGARPGASTWGVYDTISHLYYAGGGVARAIPIAHNVWTGTPCRASIYLRARQYGDGWDNHGTGLTKDSLHLVHTESSMATRGAVTGAVVGVENPFGAWCDEPVDFAGTSKGFQVDKFECVLEWAFEHCTVGN